MSIPNVRPGRAVHKERCAAWFVLSRTGGVGPVGARRPSIGAPAGGRRGGGGVGGPSWTVSRISNGGTLPSLRAQPLAGPVAAPRRRSASGRWSWVTPPAGSLAGRRPSLLRSGRSWGSSWQNLRCWKGVGTGRRVQARSSAPRARRRPRLHRPERGARARRAGRGADTDAAIDRFFQRRLADATLQAWVAHYNATVAALAGRSCVGRPLQRHRHRPDPAAPGWLGTRRGPRPLGDVCATPSPPSSVTLRRSPHAADLRALVAELPHDAPAPPGRPRRRRPARSHPAPAGAHFASIARRFPRGSGHSTWRKNAHSTWRTTVAMSSPSGLVGRGAELFGALAVEYDLRVERAFWSYRAGLVRRHAFRPSEAAPPRNVVRNGVAACAARMDDGATTRWPAVPGGVSGPNVIRRPNVVGRIEAHAMPPTRVPSTQRGPTNRSTSSARPAARARVSWPAGVEWWTAARDGSARPGTGQSDPRASQRSAQGGLAIAEGGRQPDRASSSACPPRSAFFLAGSTLSFRNSSASCFGQRCRRLLTKLRCTVQGSTPEVQRWWQARQGARWTRTVRLGVARRRP